MIPLEFINRIGVVRDLIRSGDLQQATELLDRMTQELRLLIIAMDDTEKMEILGQFAHRYDEIGATEKQIPFLEALTEIAQRDLKGMGLLASSDDIFLTATDVLILGVAYLKMKRTADARRKLTEARELFTEMDCEIDVEGMIEGRKNVYIGPKGGSEKVLSQVTDPANYKRPALVSYNFKGGGCLYVYFP